MHLIEKISFSSNRGQISVTFSEDGNSIAGQKLMADRGIREQACDYVIDNVVLNGNQRGVLFIDGGSTGYLFLMP